jgi:hypothetical protein
MKQETLAANQPFATKNPAWVSRSATGGQHGTPPFGNHVQPDRPSSPAEENEAASHQMAPATGENGDFFGIPNHFRS